MQAVYNLNSWYDANRHLFDPPVCNKLQHKKQLSIMFVGGPNTRTDFHLEQGSEFFWMVRGNMELPTIQNGERKLVTIREGQVFCLPSRIPHSPQRPEDGSLGLVVERERYVDPEILNGEEPELDGLRWFVDFDKTKGEDVLWEKFFHCYDLGRDLVPVVQEYHASEEKKTRGEKFCFFFFSFFLVLIFLVLLLLLVLLVLLFFVLLGGRSWLYITMYHINICHVPYQELDQIEATFDYILFRNFKLIYFFSFLAIFLVIILVNSFSTSTPKQIASLTTHIKDHVSTIPPAISAPCKTLCTRYRVLRFFYFLSLSICRTKSTFLRSSLNQLCHAS
jgi:3-hydroxyanthranilate 3,4-dioxygenase